MEKISPLDIMTPAGIEAFIQRHLEAGAAKLPARPLPKRRRLGWRVGIALVLGAVASCAAPAPVPAPAGSMLLTPAGAGFIIAPVYGRTGGDHA